MPLKHTAGGLLEGGRGAAADVDDVDVDVDVDSPFSSLERRECRFKSNDVMNGKAVEAIRTVC